MKLYPKRLRNINDLRREKKLLLKKSRQLGEEEIFSTNAILGKDGVSGSLTDLLPFSNPLLKKVVKMVIAKFSEKGDATKDKPHAGGDNDKKKDSLLKKAALEFIGGYLKWKTIELSYKGIKRMMK